MLSRREVLAGGLAGGLVGDSVDGRAEQSGQPPDREGQRDIERAIRAVESSIDRAFNTNSLSAGSVATLRKSFESFLRANGRFPEFCEIGIAIFYEIYDWHVRNRQQIVVVRQPDSRYSIQFMFTTLLLRYESEPGFIGVPYDRG
jgi:hypothetical protein